MTPYVWPIIALIVGLAVGSALLSPFETTRLAEPVEGIRFYPLAVTNQLTGEVTFCHLTETKPYRYTCN